MKKAENISEYHLAGNTNTNAGYSKISARDWRNWHFTADAEQNHGGGVGCWWKCRLFNKIINKIATGVYWKVFIRELQSLQQYDNTTVTPVASWGLLGKVNNN